MSLYSEYYLAHYGIKGQKWGVRRFETKDGKLTPAGKERYDDYDEGKSKKEIKREQKAAKKDVNRLFKAMNGTRLGAEAASMATFSKIHKDDYEKASDLMSSGRLLTSAKFKKNYADQSVDIFIGKSATPVMKAKITKGNEFTMDFLNKVDQQSAEEFIKYYQGRT